MLGGPTLIQIKWKWRVQVDVLLNISKILNSRELDFHKVYQMMRLQSFQRSHTPSIVKLGILLFHPSKRMIIGIIPMEFGSRMCPPTTITRPSQHEGVGNLKSRKTTTLEVYGLRRSKLRVRTRRWDPIMLRKTYTTREIKMCLSRDMEITRMLMPTWRMSLIL